MMSATGQLLPAPADKGSIVDASAFGSDLYMALTGGLLGATNELKALFLLRFKDASLSSFNSDILAVQTQVEALEARLAEVRQCIAKEHIAVRQTEAVIQACMCHTDHLNHLRTFMAAQQSLHGSPSRLPRYQNSEGRVSDGENDENAVPSNVPESSADKGCLMAQKKKKKAVPCRYVSEPEFAALSSYMTQRLTLCKVNTAIESAAELAGANMKMLNSLRQGGKLPVLERKRAQALLVGVANHEQVRGHAWMTDWDLKRSSVLKPDKTGKALMTILRHLSRIQEVRVHLNGKLETIYLVLGGG